MTERYHKGYHIVDLELRRPKPDETTIEGCARIFTHPKAKMMLNAFYIEMHRVRAVVTVPDVTGNELADRATVEAFFLAVYNGRENQAA